MSGAQINSGRSMGKLQVSAVLALLASSAVAELQ